MHRSYQNVLPCQNKLLQSRWDRQYYEEHRRKVASAGPTVDTKAPRTFLHLHLKLKKLQLEDERVGTIERDNRILLEKMTYIMRTEGRIDNRNPYEPKSLNRESRQRELLKIGTENRGVLKRIMLRQPQYDHFKWQMDWEENQRYIDMISHYPREWWLMTAEGRRKYGQQNSSRAQSRQSERSCRSVASSQRSNTKSERATEKKDSDRSEKKDSDRSEKKDKPSKKEKNDADKSKKTKKEEKKDDVEVEVEQD